MRSGRESRPRPPACLNCGSSLVDAYCAACGQRNMDMRVPARELALDAVEDGLSVDSRMGRTIVPFLFRPGFLTVEWTRGRRARFSSPLRLYLLTSFVFFLASSLASSEPALHLGVDREAEPVQATSMDAVKGLQDGIQGAPVREAPAEGGKPRKGPIVTPGTEEQHAGLRAKGWIGRRIDDRWRELAAMPEKDVARRVDAAFREWVPRVMFFLVPAATLILGLLWRRRWLSEHAVLALHLHAFAFTVFTALLVLRTLPWSGPGDVLSPVLWLWLVAWVPLALRRVYGQPWKWTLPKAALGVLLYLLALGLGLAGVGALALWFA